MTSPRRIRYATSSLAEIDSTRAASKAFEFRALRIWCEILSGADVKIVFRHAGAPGFELPTLTPATGFRSSDAIRSYVRGVMLSHNDATEEQREKTQSQRGLLSSELNHRVKNILAPVKSIATQTGASAETVDDYAKSFEGRLRALSHAHDQILRWR